MRSCSASPASPNNNVALYAGIAFVPAMIGLFGLPNIFENLSKGTSAESADVSGEKKIKIGILSMVRTNLGTSAAPLCWARPSAARSSRCSGWPSPLTFDQPEFKPYMAAFLLLASFLMRFSGWAICRGRPKPLRVPFFILMPVVGVLSIIGAYALNVNMFDLTVMFVFGLIGYLFTKLKIPAVPIVLGLILGNMTDSNFRRALQASQGSFTPFVTRPISIIVLLLIFFTMFSQTAAYKNLKSAVAFKLHKSK